MNMLEESLMKIGLAAQIQNVCTHLSQLWFPLSFPYTLTYKILHIMIHYDLVSLQNTIRESNFVNEILSTEGLQQLVIIYANPLYN